MVLSKSLKNARRTAAVRLGDLAWDWIPSGHP